MKDPNKPEFPIEGVKKGTRVEIISSPEIFPSLRELKAVFSKILKNREYKQTKLESDERGVSVYEVETTSETNEPVEYNFQRANYDFRNPALPRGARFSASIHMLDYSGGMPGGGCVMNYLDGKWTPEE